MVNIYMNWLFTAELHSKTVEESVSGQRIPTWTLQEVSDCQYLPRTSATGYGRDAPTYENNERILFMFPSNINVEYGQRIKNIKDRYGNIIEAGALQIDSISPQPGFDGRIHHLNVLTTMVMES